MKNMIISQLFVLATMLNLSLYSQEAPNIAENLEQRKQRVNEFICQELKNDTPTAEIIGTVETQFFHKTPEYQEYRRLLATKERLRKEWHQCKNTPHADAIKQGYDQTDAALEAVDPRQTPERHALDQLYTYSWNQRKIKDRTEELQKKEEILLQNIRPLEEQNQAIVQSFAPSQQTTNIVHDLQQREQTVNAFVHQKLADGTPIETIKQELDDKFCNHIPEHYVIGLLDSNKLRLKKDLEPCWKKYHHNGYFGKLEYCRALEKEYEQNKDKLREERKNRNNTPEMQAQKKLSEHRANETKIQKLNQKLQKHAEYAEEINQEIQKYKQENQTMFNSFKS